MGIHLGLVMETHLAAFERSPEPFFHESGAVCFRIERGFPLRPSRVSPNRRAASARSFSRGRSAQGMPGQLPRYPTSSTPRSWSCGFRPHQKRTFSLEPTKYARTRSTDRPSIRKPEGVRTMRARPGARNPNRSALGAGIGTQRSAEWEDCRRTGEGSVTRSPIPHCEAGRSLLRLLRPARNRLAPERSIGR